jgi:Tfp pilus assembly protein PilE
MIQPAIARRTRPGISLMELLIVVAIIIILASMALSGVMNFIRTGPRVVTRNTLKSLKAKLDNQWKAVRDRAQSETILSSVEADIIAWYAAQPTPVTLTGSDPRVRAKYIEMKLAQAFPENFKEALAPSSASGGLGLTPWSGYTTFLKTLDIPPTASSSSTYPSAENQQAICLMMALERGPANTGLKPEDLGASAVKTFIINGTQAYGCIDGWGKELRFTRGGSALTPVISTQPPNNLSTNDP